MKAKHFVKKLTKYVDIYDFLLIEKKETVGEGSGWIVKPGKAEDVFSACEEQTGILLYKKYWDELNLNGNAFLWKQFMMYPDYRGKNTGSIKGGKINHDYLFIKYKCKYLLAIPEPLYVPDDKNQFSTRNRDESEFEKSRDALIDLYIKKYTYRGNYKRHKDTGLIIKEMK
jgi:hypothetical protein